MSRKMAGLTPLLQAQLADELEAVGHFLHRRLLSYQTVTLLFDTPDSESDPKKLPALMISRLPSDDWVLELPIPSIDGPRAGSRFDFLIFNEWLGPAEEIAAAFSCGPKKVIHEADAKGFSIALLSAVEDLLLVAGNSDASKILITDKQGEVTDSLGRSLAKLVSESAGAIGILPATSSFFDESDLNNPPNPEEVQRVARQFAEVEILMNERSLNFYATTCYMGVPRNLFILDYSSNDLTVSVWNGNDFVPCKEEHIVRAIRKQGDDAQPGGPKELPAMYVSTLWPNALKKLNLPILRSDEEL